MDVPFVSTKPLSVAVAVEAAAGVMVVVEATTLLVVEVVAMEAVEADTVSTPLSGNDTN